jgi:hypothetical protein
MKEFKYNYIKGFETEDTPEQLDSFELSRLYGMYDRYIFDFTLELIDIGVGGIGENKWGWANLTKYNNEVWDVYSNMPGAARLHYKNNNDFSNTEPNYSTVPTILNDGKEVAFWNENAIMYLDERNIGLYGQSSSPNNLKNFRSGYLELTLKTDKNNCVIAYGSKDFTSPGFSYFVGRNASSGEPAAIDENNMLLSEMYSNLNELILSLKNGKLCLTYTDNYGEDAQEFEIIGNKTISDNEWHHVIINFNKPGVRRTHSEKFNSKLIEFWVDGKLDKRSDEYSKKDIFYPTFEWLLGNPALTFNKNIFGKEAEFTSYDLPRISGDINASGDAYIGTSEFNLPFTNLFNPIGDNDLFKGSVHHCIIGVNTALSKFEIQQRYRLYTNNEKSPIDSFTCSAKMITPTVLGNKKKALKLFWNNIENLENKNGIELDNNFLVDSYSVTHKLINSSTETNNVDLSNTKDLKFLPDVRVAITQNVMFWSPGSMLIDDRIEALPGTRSNGNGLTQANLNDFSRLDSFSIPNSVNIGREYTQKYIQEHTTSAFLDMPYSGVDLKVKDRILLTAQFNQKDNGIFIYNGNDLPLTRADDASSPSQINNSVVRVIDGYYKDTSWMMSNNISSLSNSKNWIQLEYHPTSETINSQPILSSRWSDNFGEKRFINFEEDLNINKYDLIVFMNYPETNEEIKESFVGYDDFEIKVKYDNFIKSLQNVCAQGASLYVSSPKLAEDLGIVKKFTQINQEVEISDAQSAALNPFEINEPADRYFDTHRNNKYELATPVTGLTNKQTYILTDFINYNPDNNYDYEQYHAKYAYRQFGLQEGNEFIIPGLSLRKITTNENLPGFVQNQRTTDTLAVVAPSDILAGTVVTKLANTYYTGSTVVNNPYDDYASTIIVYNNQVLGGQPITGKIFVNCVEDGYTFSRQEYNKAVIQVIPTPDANETTATRGWQYSTSRLNRLPRQVDLRVLTEHGQTTPTNGGGGPLIQAPSNASNGIIRSQTDLGNTNYQSDLYTSEAEEIYPIQEIPVLSMTYLGLQWLAE